MRRRCCFTLRAFELHACAGNRALRRKPGARELRTLYRDGLFIGVDSGKEEASVSTTCFVIFLTHRAKQVMVMTNLQAVRARAATEHAPEGRFEEAFELLLGLGDTERMAEIILECAATLLAEGARHCLNAGWLRSRAGGRSKRLAILLAWNVHSHDNPCCEPR